jgi:hypothetical protein
MSDKNYFLISISHQDGRGAPQRVAVPKGGAAHAVMPAPRRKGGAQVASGAAHGALHEHRTWTIIPGPSLAKYEVTDYGAKGIEITHNGTVVWSGRRTAEGYTTTRTTLSAAKLGALLKTAMEGDVATPGPVVIPAPVASPPQGRTRRPKQEAATGSREVTAAGRPMRGRRARADAPPAGAQPAGPPEAPAPKTTSAKRGPARARRKADSAQPGAGATHPAPRANRSRSAEPQTPSKATTVQVPDDDTVLAKILAELKKKNPAQAEQLFDALKRIWLGGGRAKTIAWMEGHGHRNVVKAFDSWVQANMAEAEEILKRSQNGTANSQAA